MSILGSIYSKLGYETIPAAVASKTFYELKATLPGNDNVLDFVRSDDRPPDVR